jgi:transposase
MTSSIFIAMPGNEATASALAQAHGEAGKKRLAGDTARAATSDEVKDLQREATALKEVVADLTLENRLLKKSVTADGEDEA